jgi:hypothetical protein
MEGLFMKKLQSLFSVSLISLFVFVASLGLAHTALAMSPQEKQQDNFQKKEAHEECQSLFSIPRYKRSRALNPSDKRTEVRRESFNPPASAFEIPTYKKRPKKSWFACCSTSAVQD